MLPERDRHRVEVGERDGRTNVEEMGDWWACVGTWYHEMRAGRHRRCTPASALPGPWRRKCARTGVRSMRMWQRREEEKGIGGDDETRWKREGRGDAQQNGRAVGPKTASNKIHWQRWLCRRAIPR